MDFTDISFPLPRLGRSRAVSALLGFAARHKNGLLLLWDVFMFAVVGLNSFILLLRKHGTDHGLNVVIFTGTAAYLVILTVQTVLLRRAPNRRPVLHFTKKIFRLIYTALYLTAIMMDILALGGAPGTELQMSYNGFLFIWVSLWGTNFLWIRQVFLFVRKRLGSFRARHDSCPSDAVERS